MDKKPIKEYIKEIINEETKGILNENIIEQTAMKITKFVRHKVEENEEQKLFYELLHE